jgi:hypothetical protein
VSITPITDHKDHKSLVKTVYSCMETGNFELAKTILIEYAAIAPNQAAALRKELKEEYGTGK